MAQLRLTPTLLSLLALFGCRSITSTPQYVAGSDLFCEVASDKSANLGRELVLTGSFVTDFRHYSMLLAKCGSKAEPMGFSIGFISRTETNDELEKSWWSSYCGSQKPSCNSVIPVTIRGRLVKRSDGIKLDIAQITLAR